PEGALELDDRADLKDPRLETELIRRPDRSPRGYSLGHACVVEEDHSGKLGHSLGKELDLLGDDLLVLRGEPRDVTTGTCKARHEASVDRVDQDDTNDDRDAAGRLLGGPDRRSSGQGDDVNLEPDELCGKRRKAIGVAFRPAILDRHGLAFDIAQLAQALPERLQLRARRRRRVPVPEVPDPWDLARALRLGGDRRGQEGQGASDESASV